MKKLLPVLLLITLSIILSLLVACGGSAVENETDLTDAATQQPQADSEAVGAVSTSVSDEVPVASTESVAEMPPPESIDVQFPPSYTAMLSELGDYQLDVSVSFVGQDAAGTPMTFEIMSTEMMVADQSGQRLDISTSGDGEQSQMDSVSLLRFEGLAYLVVPQVGCISGDPADFADDMKLPLDPREVLAGLSHTQQVDGDILVNGLQTTELHFDQEALAWPATGSWLISGSAFVDPSSGFVTRVAMNLDGSGDLLQDGRILDGVYDIVVDVSATVGEGALAVPEACGQSALYPVTPDAFAITAIEDLLTFKSRFPLQEIVDFYMSVMPAAGWQSISEPDVFEDLAIMNFEQAGSTLMVTVEYDADSDVVSVLVSP